jgi:hypothetical protein
MCRGDGVEGFESVRALVPITENTSFQCHFYDTEALIDFASW